MSFERFAIGTPNLGTPNNGTYRVEKIRNIIASKVYLGEVIEDQPPQYTTEPKRRPKTTINLNRKHSTVLEKIHQVFEIMWDLGYHKMISHGDMVFMISKYCGCNRGTIRSYLGHKSYGGSSKHGDRHVTHVTKGFLEQFGYAKRWRGNWILNHKNIPRRYHYVENLPISLLEDMKGSSEGNMEKISLSPLLQGKECEKTVSEVVSLSKAPKGAIVGEKEEEDTAREINFRSKKHIKAYSGISDMHGKDDGYEVYKDEYERVQD